MSMRRAPLVHLCLAAAFVAPLGGCAEFGLWRKSHEVEAVADTAGDTGPPSGYTDPPPTDAPVAGRVYSIDPRGLDVVRPAGMEELLRDALDRNLLVYVASESESTLGLAFTLAAAGGGQNECEAVRELPGGRWNNPQFVAGPGDVEVSFQGARVMLHEVEVTGLFTQSGASWTGSVHALLDVRDIAFALPTDEDACDVVAEMGGDCDLCDDGTQACVRLDFVNVYATEADIPFNPAPDDGAC